MTVCDWAECKDEAVTGRGELRYCEVHAKIFDKATEKQCIALNCNRPGKYPLTDVDSQTVKGYLCELHIKIATGQLGAMEKPQTAWCEECGVEIPNSVRAKDGCHYCEKHSPRKEHPTGAVRSTDADNVRYDLISPIALESLAQTYAEGARKYGDNNCLKGFPVSDLLNHALRHIYLFLSGDRSEDHLGHAMWNVGMAIHSYKSWPELNKGLLEAGCKLPN